MPSGDNFKDVAEPGSVELAPPNVLDVGGESGVVKASRGPLSEPGFGEQPTPPDTGDPEFAWTRGGYARTTEVAAWIHEEIVQRVRAIRTFRLTREEAWADSWRMWQMEHDRQGYVGRSNLYIPAVHKAIEQLVAVTSQSLFPTNDLIDVQPGRGIDGIDPDAALAIRDALQWDLIQQAQLKRYTKTFLRQLFVTGTSPLKIFWREEKRRVTKKLPRTTMFGQTVAPAGTEYEDEETAYCGPVVRPIDMFNFYIWPETALNLREAEIIIEVMELHPDTLRRREAEGQYVDVDMAIRDVNSTLANPNLIDLVGRTTGMLLPPENPATSGRLRPIRLLDVWLNLKLPDAELRGYRKGFPEPAVVTMTEGGTILRVMPNPFDHKEPPFEMARLKEILFSAYGKGHPDVVSGLQHLVNDQTNQSQDVATFCLNPIVKRAAGAIGGPLPQIRPGVVLRVLNKDDITFDRPPFELATQGLQSAQATIQQINDFIGAPPVMQGQNPVGRGARTAAGMRILQGNTMLPMQDIVEDTEDQCLRPLLYKCACLREQFKPTGLPVHKMVYTWMASDQTGNQQVRAQQILQGIQIGLQAAQAMQPFGETINPAPLLRRYYTEGLGFRDVDQFIVKLPPGIAPLAGAQPSGPPTPNIQPTYGGEGGSPEDNLENSVMQQDQGIEGMRGGLSLPPMGAGLEGGSNPGIPGITTIKGGV